MPVTGGQRGVTAIVGPNGSGKSNLADAVRWVMGEQSLKLLRSKKSEDVIFSGTEKRPRSGFAEVTMMLVNDDENATIDLPEVVVARRLYRDGQSEYEVNKQPARLADVILLLAQCGIGQRTYSVIGQGMVDAVLSASPAERKEFFDEAAGLRVFQLKRTQAVNKLDATRDNLARSDALVREIEPRLTSLERQVKRLKEREQIEAELREIERAYFGGVWIELREKLEIAAAAHQKAEKEFATQNAEAEKFERDLALLERATPVSTDVRELRDAIDACKEERAKLREDQIRFESKREISHARGAMPLVPFPLSKIIDELDAIAKAHIELDDLVATDTPDLKKLRVVLAKLRATSDELLHRLKHPVPVRGASQMEDTTLEKEIKQISAAIAEMTAKIVELETRLKDLLKQEESGRAHLFETQRRLTALRHDVQDAERKRSEASVDVARQETRREAFFAELRGTAPQLEVELSQLASCSSQLASGGQSESEIQAPSSELRATSPEALHARMQKLRSQLEWIGGIDPATITEHDETKQRFETLTTQATDLREATHSLEIVIAELDTTLRERSEIAFKQLNREFNAYFKKLFGGGEAELIQLETEPVQDEEENVIEDQSRQNIVGIELHATPPGKRLKSIALLSGGERALTSIALICAIMATNPSPFVVLDEVDAALDEVNSKKFAEILECLVDQTQFVVITHNRATMQMANVLYGVTMGEEGASQVLSVKLAR